jgi:hypothetical protein
MFTDIQQITTPLAAVGQRELHECFVLLTDTKPLGATLVGI